MAAVSLRASFSFISGLKRSVCLSTQDLIAFSISFSHSISNTDVEFAI